jgi:hypothetical protein
MEWGSHVIPIVFLRVGYMTDYDGSGEISGGGQYVRENGVGGEVFNFAPSRGRCYGYAMSKSFGGIRLRALTGTGKWAKGDELPGVDVVFIALRPGVGQVIVGWYRNATVFHKHYGERPGSIPGMEREGRRYLCSTDARDAYLLPEQKRLFKVPTAMSGNKGFPGQSNVWYPAIHLGEPDVKEFVQRVRSYIGRSRQQAVAPADEASKVGAKRRGWPRRPDHAHNALVEAIAVDYAWQHFEQQKWRVKSVETENHGWDLVVSRGNQILHVEVKGTSLESVGFELTPNEFLRLQERSKTYRVCVVCKVFSGKPEIFVLSPRLVRDEWHLHQKSPPMRVGLMARVAAIGREI